MNVETELMYTFAVKHCTVWSLSWKFLNNKNREWSNGGQDMVGSYYLQLDFGVI